VAIVGGVVLVQRGGAEDGREVEGVHAEIDEMVAVFATSLAAVTAGQG
jgi:hypothetical protein